MTTENVKSILALLMANYSNSFKNVEKKDMELIIKTWETQFKDYTFDEVYKAIMSIMANDTSGFAPSIGRIKEELNKKYKESVMPSEEAWSIVLNKASCNPIKARANFEALPGKHPKFLESLGNANISSQGTFKKDFVKNYKETIENDYQEMNANAITRLEFCERNAIPGETIKALTGVTDLKQIR